MNLRVTLFLLFSVRLLSGQIDTTINQIGEFPGGVTKMHETIKNNLRYPAISRTEMIQGKCYIKFIVDTLGNPTNIQVQKSLRPDYDTAAMQAVKYLTGWTPSRLKGRKVQINMSIPINFTVTDIKDK
jgi:protein TonB